MKMSMWHGMMIMYGWRPVYDMFDVQVGYYLKRDPKIKVPACQFETWAELGETPPPF